ncbi:MAG: cupin domain-containing protein [Pseudomonadota bacterium]
MTKSCDNTPEALDATVLNALVDSIAPLAPPAGLRDKVLARVREHPGAGGLITVRAGDAGWKPIAPGLEYKLLLIDPHSRTKSFLLRAAPGTSLPPHGHSGFEECLVLEGEFSMGDLTLRAGDFHCAAAHALHEEARTERGVLVYLRASIDDYPFVAA